MSPRHLSCPACRIRLHASAPEVALLDGRCPICGAMLTPVSSALDVLGFRSFSLDQLSGDQRNSPGTLADFAARLEAASVQAEPDGDRWPNEGGIVSAESAVALRAEPPLPARPRRT